MADSKISGLPVLTTPSPADAIPVLQGGVTKQESRDDFVSNISIPISQVDGLQTSLNTITTNQTNDHNQIVVNTNDILTLDSEIDQANVRIDTAGLMIDQKANLATTITAAGLLTGGGSLAANRTITLASSSVLQPANNLNDVANITTARSNLGLGSAATQPTSTFLLSANNLSDVANTTTAMANLGVTAAITPLGYGVQNIISSTSVALTNPIKNVLLVNFTSPGCILSLPKMNDANSFPEGKDLLIVNIGSNDFKVRFFNSGTDQFTLTPQRRRIIHCTNSNDSGGTGSWYLDTTYISDLPTLQTTLDAKVNTADAMLRGLFEEELNLADIKAFDGAYVGADVISANKNAISGPYFPNGVDSAITLKKAMPKRWNGGAIGFRVHIAANTTSSGTARFRLFMISRVNAGTFNQAFTTYADASVNFNGLGNAYDIMISSISNFITPPGSLVYPCQIEFRLVRTGTISDTVAVPVILEKLSLFYTTDKGNDA